MLNLFVKYRSKAVGATAAKVYQKLTGKVIVLSSDEEKIWQGMQEIIKNNKLEETPATIKQIFQERSRPIAAVVNLLTFTEDMKTQEEVQKLRQILIPSDEVAAIFNRLGENFTPHSGVVPLSEDVQYLQNLVIKRTDELLPKERELLLETITQIDSQVIILQGIFDKIKNKFEGFRQSVGGTKNEQLNDKLGQIEKILYAKETLQVLTSTMTGDLNTVIENIRACLDVCVRVIITILI